MVSRADIARNVDLTFAVGGEFDTRSREPMKPMFFQTFTPMSTIGDPVSTLNSTLCPLINSACRGFLIACVCFDKVITDIENVL